MSAVATRPRAHSRASAEPTLGEHISEMRAKLQQVDRLLSQAWDACEESSTTDTLLRHLIEDLLPDTMMALKVEQLDQGITGKAYDDLFLPLALLDSIVTINAGTVLHHTLSSAWTQLDEAQTSLDNAGWSRQLPAAPAPAAAPYAKSSAGADSSDEDTPVELAWWRASEAIGILELTDNSDAVFGARVLLEQATEIIKEQSPAGQDARRCEQASLLLCYVIGILQADAADRTDHAQNGALTLVQLAKDHLDSHWDKVPRHA